MQCQVCGFILPHIYHSKYCEQKIEYQCRKCDKTFDTMKYLQKHEIVHANYSYRCMFCSKNLSSQFNLDVHIKSKHVQNIDFKICKVCSAKFKRKSDLNRHERVHANIKFVCDYCDKEFSFKCNLLRHVNSIHKK